MRLNLSAAAVALALVAAPVTAVIVPAAAHADTVSPQGTARPSCSITVDQRVATFRVRHVPTGTHVVAYFSHGDSTVTHTRHGISRHGVARIPLVASGWTADETSVSAYVVTDRGLFGCTAR